MTNTKQSTQTNAAAFELHDQDLENVVGGRYFRVTAAGIDPAEIFNTSTVDFGTKTDANAK